MFFTFCLLELMFIINIDMNQNSNKTNIQQYLNELKLDLTNQQKFKVRYQTKILELLISLEESRMAYDYLNLAMVQVKRSNQRLESELVERSGKVSALEDEKNELDFEVKGFKFQMSKLQQTNAQLNNKIQEMQAGHTSEQQKWAKKNSQLEAKYKIQIERLSIETKSYQTQNTALLQQNRKLQQAKIQIQQKFKQDIAAKQTQLNGRIQIIKNQSDLNQKSLNKQFLDKISELEKEKQKNTIQFDQDRKQLSQNIQKLQLKLKAVQSKLQEATAEKSSYQNSQQNLSRDIKQKQKQIKLLKKQNLEMAQQIVELKQQNEQVKLELSSIQTKRKQLAKRQIQLKKQLEQKYEEFANQNQTLNKQKEIMRDLKEEIRKLKETVQNYEVKLKQHQSNLYKANIALEQDKKKLQESQVKIEYMEAANINLNKKLACEENNKQTLVKSIVNEKQWAQKQNIKLIQMLQIKQSIIKAILENGLDVQLPKLMDLGVQSRTKQNWNSLMKENLKDETIRKKAIQKFIINRVGN